MNFTLVFDPEEQSYVDENLLPLTKDLVTESARFDENNPPAVSENDFFLLYLSDDQIKKYLDVLMDASITFAVLPHPGAKLFCKLAGVDPKMEKAVEHLRGEPDTVEMDLMYCNGEAVFSSVVIGSAFQLTDNNIELPLSRWKKLMKYLRNLLKIQPFLLEITKSDGHKIKTSVAGVMVTMHQTHSLLSRYIPEKMVVNDGMFHALLLSPRSVLELVNFALRPLWKKSALPGFGAHIKTDQIQFEGRREDLVYKVDGIKHSSPSVDLSVKKKALKIAGGSLLPISEESPSAKEIYKTHALPSGEAASELSQRKVPFVKRASTEEFKDLFNVLRDNARLKNTYMVLMILSTSLATLGLFANSSPVVIGAMILAPLMSPIISLSMASLRQDRRLVWDSSSTILAGLAASFFFAVLITWITPIQSANSEILIRTKPTLVDLGIAVLSGIAGAYAHAREEIAKTLAGVAIAVALVPPLAVAGIGLGWLDWQIFSGAVLLLFTNLTGMVLAGSLTFMALGFSPFRLASKGLFIWFIVVGLFSIPLYLSFNQMLYEHRVVNALDGWETENVILRDVRLKSKNPLNLSVVIVSPKTLDDEEIRVIKEGIEQRLDETVELEISIALKR